MFYILCFGLFFFCLISCLFFFILNLEFLIENIVKKICFFLLIYFVKMYYSKNNIYFYDFLKRFFDKSYYEVVMIKND